MSSPKSVVGDPKPKGMDSRQQSAGMTKGGSLDFCFFVSRERKKKINKR
jgi:hypothetical protein